MLPCGYNYCWKSPKLVQYSETPSNSSQLTFDFPTIATDSNPPLIMGSAGEMFSFSKRKEDYTLSESISPVGAGPEPHIQKGYGEFFYLPEGNVKFWVGDKTYPGDSIPGKNASKSDVYSIVTKPGDLLYVPPYTVHGFESLLAPDLITESNSYKFLNKSSFISAALIFGSLSAI